MKHRLTIFDTAVVKNFKNDDEFDIGARFFDFRNQNVKIQYGNVSENIDPVTSLALMQRAIYDLSTANITDFRLNTSSGRKIAQLVGNFSMIYDQIIDYHESEYFIQPY